MHSIGTPVFWLSFISVIVILLMIDLGVFQRKAHEVRVKEAACWSIIWIALSLCFGFWIYHSFGRQQGLEFFAGYLIEYALSVDNIFVFILIFSYFAVPSRLHHRVLFWGILSALIMRAAFIAAGAALISSFHWTLYIFGAFLIYTGGKIMIQGDAEVNPGHNPVVRIFQRFIPLTSDFQSGKFFLWNKGKLFATPLALVLVTVEVTDLVFATDSIPAIFGVTRDPFIIYTSNVCAILGLRSLYFLLAAVIKRFAYLGTGLGFVLIFIGIKMLTSGFLHISIELSLSIVAVILAGSIAFSIFFPPKNS
jgi:tellurite resistance protein TerC